MRKIYFILLFVSHAVIAQSTYLNYNNVRAKVNLNGCLFTESSTNRASYEVPKSIDGSSPDVIYNSSFWIGAKDQNNSVRVCANKFINDPKDFKTGPVANNYNNQSFIAKYDRIYSINKLEIDYHQVNWSDPNYSIPIDILDWPGNGDTGNGEAAVLAPFVDYNGNSIYEPQLGDHPAIRGDQISYFILNDNDGSHALTGGDKLNMEYHFMIYQYSTNNYLNEATFINLKVINRSQETYNQLIITNYTDFDIGGYNDDYIGSSSTKNMVFGYNGDNLDNGSSVNSFGVNPPTCGIKLLNHSVGIAGSYSNSTGIQSDPSIIPEFWNYMTGKWSDGSNFTIGGNGYGGTIPTNFIYDGNPNDANAWTEVSTQSLPGDRRGFIASEPIDNFAPNDFICYDYAVLYSRTGGNNLLNVNGLFDVADSAQAFYDAQPYFYCETVLLSDLELDLTDNLPTIYPNPSQAQFRVQLEGKFNIEIYAINGKLVKSIQGLNSNSVIKTPSKTGIYFVTIKQNNNVQTLKLIVK